MFLCLYLCHFAHKFIDIIHVIPVFCFIFAQLHLHPYVPSAGTESSGGLAERLVSQKKTGKLSVTAKNPRHTNCFPFYKKISAAVRVNSSLTATLLWQEQSPQANFGSPSPGHGGEPDGLFAPPFTLSPWAEQNSSQYDPRPSGPPP